MTTGDGLSDSRLTPFLGPVFYAWGSSPYLDWFFETHYIHNRARSQ